MAEAFSPRAIAADPAPSASRELSPRLGQALQVIAQRNHVGRFAHPIAQGAEPYQGFVLRYVEQGLAFPPGSA